MNKSLPNLFNLTKDIYRWYSEVTYNLTEEEVIAYIKDYNKNYLINEEKFISDSENFKLYKSTGIALWRTFRLEEAEPFLEKINEKDTDSTEILFYLGEIALEKKEYQKAINYFNDYIKIHPIHIPLNQNFPLLHNKKEKEPNYISDNNYLLDFWFIDFHRYDANTIEAYTYLGDIYSILGNNEKAIYYYNEGIKTAPTHHLAPYISLANLFEKQNEDLILIINLYEKATNNLLTTNWLIYHNADNMCDYYPKLAIWAKEKYRYTYYYPNYYLLAYQFSDLGDKCKNKKIALTCYEKSIKLWDLFTRKLYNPSLYNPYNFYYNYEHWYKCDRDLKSNKTRIDLQKKYPLEKIDLVIKKAKLLLELYKDYWQVELICEKLLIGSNKNHPELKKLIEEAKKGKGI